jgi:uncharacterized protein (DUF2384 family)
MSASLAEALAAFQAEAPTFHKSKTAKVQTRTGGEYSYRYADLSDILPVVGPLLAKHGLSWSSKPGRADDGVLVLQYRLLHSSGEVDAGEMPLGVAAGCKPQELGSAITYARRYALTAQLNVATDEDDDGRAAQAAQPSRSASTDGRTVDRITVAPVAVAAPVEATERVASARQRGMLNAKAADARLTSCQFAEVVTRVWKGKPDVFESNAVAQAWLNRHLDRLPARHVDSILAALEPVEAAA